MFNSKITGLLTAAALTALTAMTAFAETPAAATIPASAVVPASAAVDYHVTVSEGRPGSYAFTASKMAPSGAVKGELKTDENGKQYFVTKDGETVYISVARLPGEAASAAQITVTTTGK